MFDSLVAAALADQLTTECLDGRVQSVGLLSRRAIALEIYANHRRTHLIASAESQAATVYLTSETPVRDRQLVTPFLLLLRKYVRGSRLVGIQQPPLERHLTLSFATPRYRNSGLADITSDVEEQEEPEDDAEDDVIFTHLNLEIMGRHSNLILVDDDDLIMEAVKRVSLHMSRVRPVSPRRAYLPPPERDLKDPRRATEAEMSALVSAEMAEKAVVRMLTGTFRGVSPQIAREVAYRSQGADSTCDPGALARNLRNVFEPLLTSEWNPAIYLDQDSPIAYSPITLSHLRETLEERTVNTISEAIVACEGQATPTSEAGKHHLRTQRLVASIQAGLDKVEAQSGSLDVQEMRHKDREQYRIWGEAIFGYMWQIQRGDTELLVGDLVVPLDPSLSPSEQARDYMDLYTRGKSSDAQIQGVREELDSRRAYLEQLLVLAGQARSIQDIEDLEAEWFSAQPDQAKGKPPRRSSGRKRTIPTLVVRDQPIYVGHSGAENDRVTFDIAGPEDTWLHARGVPGSHVVVKWNSGVRDLDDVLHRAAEIAAHFSQARQNGRVEVDITQRKHVRKIKGAGPGMVTYRNERTISVNPVAPD